MSDWLTGTVVAVALVSAFLMGATWGTRREMRLHEEFHALTACPKGMYDSCTCIPEGCHVDATETRRLVCDAGR